MSAYPSGLKPPFPPAVSRIGWRASGIELTERAARLWRRASAELRVDAAMPESDLRESLALLAEACAGELRYGTVDAARSAELAEVAAEIQRLLDDMSKRTMLAHARRLEDCEQGLVRLRDMPTTAALIDGVCDELVRSLGFARAMLARVESGMWRPWKANASMLGEAWVGEWIERAIPLDELTLETRMLSERRPELVLDTRVPGIAQMVHAAAVRSYVAAPIMPNGQVVGFFHADHGIGGATCDAIDRDLLWRFAEGFGHLYERTTLWEQLDARREQVRKTIAEVNEAMDQLADANLELGSHSAELTASGRAGLVRQGISDRLEQLTPRELEVLELIVAGARNGEIGDRLAITLGTVKSHVKNILAKLGVVNRSQAIALYLGVEQTQSPLS